MIVRRWGARTGGNPQLLQSSGTCRGASEGGKAPGRAPGSVGGREGPGGFRQHWPDNLEPGDGRRGRLQLWTHVIPIWHLDILKIKHQLLSCELPTLLSPFTAALNHQPGSGHLFLAGLHGRISNHHRKGAKRPGNLAPWLYFTGWTPP